MSRSPPPRALFTFDKYLICPSGTTGYIGNASTSGFRRMHINSSWRSVFAAGVLLINALASAAEPAVGDFLFRDQFIGKLADGWAWEREDPSDWRVGPLGLEVRVRPGNMWGGANNARNVLWRSIPAPEETPVEISVTLSNAPTGQWEQANLVWFYDDSNMVKLGQELVTGRYSIVMGREEGDRARTVAIIPLDANTVELRLQAVKSRVRGQFRTAPWSQWRDVGECDLPAKGGPKASLHFYNGPPNEEHWARVSQFAVRRLPAAALTWPRTRVAECFHGAAGPSARSGLGTLELQQGFTLVSELYGQAGDAKAELEQRLFLNSDGSYGWSWDRRVSASKAPTALGVGWGAIGNWRDRPGLRAESTGSYAWKSAEIEFDAITRLENDSGDHNLAAVVWLSAGAVPVGPPSHRLTILFDWYGPASEVRTLNDGYRDYGLVQSSPDSHEIRYRIRGFRGAPPRVNLKAFLDAAVALGIGPVRVCGIWFGNEIWDGSRGGTRVAKLDLVVDGRRYSSAPPQPGE